MELLSSFMRVLHDQDDSKYLLKRLESNVERYSVLINEIIDRLYKAHHRGMRCPFDCNVLISLAFTIKAFITEYKSENAFWLEQGVVIRKYAHVYDSWFLESWLSLTVDDLNQWTDTMEKLIQDLKIRIIRKNKKLKMN